MTNQLTKLFNYEGNEVTFKNEKGVVYVNATQMAKPFGKLPAEYLRLSSTKTLLEAIVGKSHIAECDLVITSRGGAAPGTWMHEDVAIDYAQWLSVNFRLWCNDRIKELLTTGSTSLMSVEEMTLTVMTQLTRTVEAQKAELNAAKTRIAKSQPVIDYTNEVLQNPTALTTNVVALSLGMSAQALNKRLKQLKIVYEQSGILLLASQLRDKGYAKMRTPKKGNPYLVWTELGKAFIHSKVNPIMIESFEKRAEFLTSSK